MCYCTWCAALVLLDVVGSGCGALRCRVQAQCSHPTLLFRAKVKNKWSCTSAQPSCLNGIDLDTFTFTFYK